MKIPSPPKVKVYVPESDLKEGIKFAKEAWPVTEMLGEPLMARILLCFATQELRKQRKNAVHPDVKYNMMPKNMGHDKD